MSLTERGWMTAAALATLIVGSQLIPASALADPEGPAQPDPVGGRPGSAAQRRIPRPCRRRLARSGDHVRSRGRSDPDGQSDHAPRPYLRGEHRVARVRHREYADLHRMAVLREPDLRNPGGRRDRLEGRGLHRTARPAGQGRSRLRCTDLPSASEWCADSARGEVPPADPAAGRGPPPTALFPRRPSRLAPGCQPVASAHALARQ